MQELIVPYCERLTSGAEPVNTVSNLFFAAAGVTCMFLLWRRQASGAKSGTSGTVRLLWMLSVLPIALAAGSGLFHALPSATTHILDLLPIGLFSVLAIGLLLRAHWKIPGYAVLIIILLWALMTSISATRPDVLAGSMLYLPTAVMLFLMSFASKSLRKPLSYVALVYLTALLLRALDLPACAALPHGTHWLWHLLSAITIILVFRILLNATATQPHTTCRRVE